MSIAPVPPALRFILRTFSGLVNSHQQRVIGYGREPRPAERLAVRWLRVTDDEGRRLAVKGNVLGRNVLSQVAGIAIPDNILRWHRRFVAKKHDGATQRGPGRPASDKDIAALLVRMAQEDLLGPGGDVLE